MTDAVALPGPGAWSFDDVALAGAFDAHVREQLPWYDLATRLVVHVAEHYLGEGGLVYDVGAATGNISGALVPLAERRHARIVAIESSAAMCTTFAPRSPVLELHLADAVGFTYEPYDLGVCFLVLMFLGIADRRALLAQLVATLRPGGALVLVERWLRPLPPYLALCSQRLTLAEKLRAGATPAAILAKEAALAGVQRPLDAGVLAPLGLPAVELFRCGEFAAVVIERPE